jgi:hypothetical protein
MLLSLENPGPRKPWDWSRMKRSVVPAFPVTLTESVFVVVASPQSTGTRPKRSSPPAATFRVASDPDVMVAVTLFAPAL